MLVKGYEINKMSHREAMALPDHFTSSFGENLDTSGNQLASLGREQLVTAFESPTTTPETRFQIGIRLAQVGDPRISVTDPIMIPIAETEFTMGSDEAVVDGLLNQFGKYGVIRDWLLKECPSHLVQVSAFKIGKFPVTNLEFRAFLLETNTPFIPKSWAFGRYPAERANHPVYGITPEAADAYVVWLSSRTGRNFRLPTEPEWELAAGGYKGWEYPWGNEFREGFCNTVEAGFLNTTPVGMFPQGNTLNGICDMAGNVEEILSTTYAPYDGGVVIEDDIYEDNPSYRMTRGGGFTRFLDLARIKRRHGFLLNSLYANGFRLCEG